MGSNETYPEERFEHEVTLDGFWIDVHEVTNRQFARFIEETGYVTVAERTPELGEAALEALLAVYIATCRAKAMLLCRSFEVRSLDRRWKW